jgi:hypothetical protein
MRKCWLLGDACALGMMFVPGGMVLVGKGNILSYVHGSNNLISGVLFFSFKLLHGGFLFDGTNFCV